MESSSSLNPDEQINGNEGNKDGDLDGDGNNEDNEDKDGDNEDNNNTSTINDDEIKMLLNEFFVIDTKILETANDLKIVRRKYLEMKQAIKQFMKAKKVERLNTNTSGSIVLKTRQQAEPVNKKFFMTRISETFNKSNDEVCQIVEGWDQKFYTLQICETFHKSHDEALQIVEAWIKNRKVREIQTVMVKRAKKKFYSSSKK